MRTLDYFFIKEFQWKTNWFSNTGILRANIKPSTEFIQKYGYIDYDIIGQVFLYNEEFKYIDSTELIILEIKKVIALDIPFFIISNEFLSLKIESLFTRPIDYFGDSEGIEAPLSWNISTPQELQNIPTKEVLQLFEDWKQFLEEQKNVSFK